LSDGEDVEDIDEYVGGRKEVDEIERSVMLLVSNIGGFEPASFLYCRLKG